MKKWLEKCDKDACSTTKTLTSAAHIPKD